MLETDDNPKPKQTPEKISMPENIERYSTGHPKRLERTLKRILHRNPRQKAICRLIKYELKVVGAEC